MWKSTPQPANTFLLFNRNLKAEPLQNEFRKLTICTWGEKFEIPIPGLLEHAGQSDTNMRFGHIRICRGPQLGRLLPSIKLTELVAGSDTE